LVDNLVNTPTYNIFEASKKLLIKESQMSDLCQQNAESGVIPENTEVSMNWGTGKKSKGRADSLKLQNNHLLPRVRKRKVLKVRQQLAEGKYEIGKRLNTVVDRILEDILE
jgi:hypothetical protein